MSNLGLVLKMHDSWYVGANAYLFSIAVKFCRDRDDHNLCGGQPEWPERERWGREGGGRERWREGWSEGGRESKRREGGKLKRGDKLL